MKLSRVLFDSFLFLLFFNFLNIKNSACNEEPRHTTAVQRVKHATAKPRLRRGSQGEGSKKDPGNLGYPRLIYSPTTGLPDVNRMQNDSSQSPTWGPKLINSLYPLSENSLGAYGVLLLSLVVFAVGIVGNLSIMCIVWHSMSMKSAWDSILAGVALWDFLLLFFCLPVVVFQEITHRRLLGVLSCRIVPFMEVRIYLFLHWCICKKKT